MPSGNRVARWPKPLTSEQLGLSAQVDDQPISGCGNLADVHIFRADWITNEGKATGPNYPGYATLHKKELIWNEINDDNASLFALPDSKDSHTASKAENVISIVSKKTGQRRFQNGADSQQAGNRLSGSQPEMYNFELD